MFTSHTALVFKGVVSFIVRKLNVFFFRDFSGDFQFFFLGYELLQPMHCKIMLISNILNRFYWIIVLVRKLAGQQINHQVCFKFLNMIFLAIDYYYIKQNLSILPLEQSRLSSDRAFHLKKINIYYNSLKWLSWPYHPLKS